MFPSCRLKEALLLAVVALNYVSGTPHKIKESKPNFVILFADDVSYAWII